jgi:K+-sensing histidine kinase KdpD
MLLDDKAVIVPIASPKNSHEYIRFMVIDSGIGISDDRLGSIFNLFEHNQNNPLTESCKNKSCKPNNFLSKYV